MLVFKENVKAFVYDSSNDTVIKVFNRQLSTEESILIMEVVDDGLNNSSSNSSPLFR